MKQTQSIVSKKTAVVFVALVPLLAFSQFQMPNQRLSQGDRLDFSVDTAKVLANTEKRIGGISFCFLKGWATGKGPYDKQGGYVLSPKMENAIRELKLPMTRFHEITWGFDKEINKFAALDRLASLLDTLKIPQETTPLSLNDYDSRRTTHPLITPKEWVDLVAYSKRKGYRFKYWEIVNEPWIGSVYGSKTAMFRAPGDYVAYLTNVSAAIHAADPAALVGADIITPWAGGYPPKAPFLGGLPDDSWGTNVLGKAAGYYEWVAGHFYSYARPNQPLDEYFFRNNFETMNNVQRLNNALHKLNPAHPAYQYDTEWATAEGNMPPRVAGNMVGVLHHAIRLIYYTRESLMKGASAWQMLSTSAEKDMNFAILNMQDDSVTSMRYWLYYYFNRHMGDWVLDIKGTAPQQSMRTGKDKTIPVVKTPPLVTVNSNKTEMYLMVANGDWKNDCPCNMTVTGMNITSISAVVLNNGDANASPWIHQQSEFVSPQAMTLATTAGQSKISFTLPAHSVVFATCKSVKTGAVR